MKHLVLETLEDENNIYGILEAVKNTIPLDEQAPVKMAILVRLKSLIKEMPEATTAPESKKNKKNGS